MGAPFHKAIFTLGVHIPVRLPRERENSVLYGRGDFLKSVFPFSLLLHTEDIMVDLKASLKAVPAIYRGSQFCFFPLLLLLTISMLYKAKRCLSSWNKQDFLLIVSMNIHLLGRSLLIIA